MVADHLSRLIVEPIDDNMPIKESFPDEATHVRFSLALVSWILLTILLLGQLPTHWGKQDRVKFLVEVKNSFGKIHTCSNTASTQIIRRCVLENEAS